MGQRWDDLLARSVAEAAAYDQALRTAMGKLNRRAMSRSQLNGKLRQLGFDQPLRQRVLDRLTALGLLDDEALGRALIHQVTLRRPAGPRLLREKLAQKGLARPTIDCLLSEVAGSTDPLQQALVLARHHLGQRGGLEPRVRRRRLYGLLTRRGFDPDTIDAALRALPENLGEPTDN